MNIVTPQQILNEISTADVYRKFYSDIDERLFMALMNGQSKLTPFHKICLDYIKNEQNEDRVAMIAELVGDEWAHMDNDKRQELISMAKDGEIKPDFVSIKNSIRDVNNIKYHNSAAASKDGYQVLYEDGNIKLTVTYTYSANAHYYGFTKWCTASDIYGEWNGWTMFNSYITDDYSDEIYAFYLQIILKDGSNMFQVTMNRRGRIQDAFDVDDNETNEGIIIDNWDSRAKIEWIDLFAKGYIKPDELLSKTQESVKDENIFMKKLMKKKSEEILKQINTDVANGKYKELIQLSIEKILKGNGDPYDMKTGVRTTSWSYTRTQVTPKFSYFFSEIFPLNEKYQHFYEKMREDYGYRCAITFCEKETGRIIYQEFFNKCCKGLIYGVFGVIMEEQFSRVVSRIINLETREVLFGGYKNEYDDAIWYMVGYDEGYIAFGQISWDVYAIQTGQLIAKKVFGLDLDENGHFYYYKTPNGRQNGEDPIILRPILNQSLASQQISEMKRIDDKINSK